MNKNAMSEGEKKLSILTFDDAMIVIRERMR